MSGQNLNANVSRRRIVSSIGAFGLGMAVGPVATVSAGSLRRSQGDVADDVEFVERTRIEAILAHDAERVGLMTADDFEFITPLGDVQTHESFIGGIAAGVIDNHVLEPTGPMQIRAYGDAAAARYQARSELTVGDIDFALDLWFTALYERRDGAWKIVWLQATELPNEQAVMNPADHGLIPQGVLPKAV